MCSDCLQEHSQLNQSYFDMQDGNMFHLIMAVLCGKLLSCYVVHEILMFWVYSFFYHFAKARLDREQNEELKIVCGSVRVCLFCLLIKLNVIAIHLSDTYIKGRTKSNFTVTHYDISLAFWVAVPRRNFCRADEGLQHVSCSTLLKDKEKALLGWPLRSQIGCIWIDAFVWNPHSHLNTF